MKFQERLVEAGGFRIRYLEAGTGRTLVCLHGAGGLHITTSHEMLAVHYRVIAFEMPGFGETENQRSSITDLADTIAAACENLALSAFNLMGTSIGGLVALWLAVRHPARVAALVLDAPAAIRADATPPLSGSPEERARRLYAHPERMPPLPDVSPALAEQRLALTRRLRGPARDPALEDAIRRLEMPVLVLFGTRDGLVSPDLGRIYKELLPAAHLVFVYDAGHAIGAERPEAFVEVVEDFLERNDAFVISQANTVLSP